jgi:predicted permease
MTLIMACGAAWRFAKPAGLSAEQTRQVLTAVVYYLLLPALVLEVLWTADIGWHSFQYTLLGMGCIVIAMLCLWIVGALFKFEDRRLGAMILAAAFPNVTYLGLPVLEQAFGSWARSVVMQMDLFSATPLLFTVGALIAKHYGEVGVEKQKSLWLFFNSPPFWAAAVAVLLNVNGIVAPVWLLGLLQKLSVAVVPLMLFSLGLALSWQAVSVRNIPYVLPVIIIKMLLMPIVAMVIVGFLPLAFDYKAAAVLDLAMPSMVLGIVICDRYRLDSSLYAMAVTITTVISLISLPFWYGVMMNLR